MMKSVTSLLLCLLTCATLCANAQQIVGTPPRVSFSVNPPIFRYAMPFTAQCYISAFNQFERNVEITFYAFLPTNLPGIPFAKVDIATYLLTSGYSISYRERYNNRSMLTYARGSIANYPTFELLITPNSAESRTIYGCYLKSGISLSANDVFYSNEYNFNGAKSNLISISLAALLMFCSVLVNFKLN